MLYYLSCKLSIQLVINTGENNTTLNLAVRYHARPGVMAFLSAESLIGITRRAGRKWYVPVTYSFTMTKSYVTPLETCKALTLFWPWNGLQTRTNITYIMKPCLERLLVIHGVFNLDLLVNGNEVLTVWPDSSYNVPLRIPRLANRSDLEFEVEFQCHERSNLM